MNDTADKSETANPMFILHTQMLFVPSQNRSVDILIDHIFDDDDFKTVLRERLNSVGSQLADQDAFLDFCEQLLPEAAADPVAQAQRLTDFKNTRDDIDDRFNPNKKPNPEAVWWPDPTHGGKPLHEVLPLGARYPFIDQSTVIGSAGSCFAVEIAQNLIRRGFNYLCLETTYDPETGTMMAESDPDNPAVQFSCRWGILFNTPSFTQIVENAFGEKNIGNFLINVGSAYMDPYREAVAFPTLEAYAAEREKHLANTRAVFEQAEVFVITLGLNEAWQYLPDETYISRNPRNQNMRGLLTHRKLTVQENIDHLQRFIDIVRHHNPNLKLIISVSPVPFMATGRADKHHVITANTHSKAVLRVAAEEIVERNKDVFYFPSYEVVTVCSKEIWTEDQRHIHPSAVARVMDLFDEMFLTRAAKNLEKLQAAEGA
ncbi:MAG TPA: hypothetical protein DC046_12300 [Rhodospirillaceae bacterium]|nr:hypothetical protein [Rhodospirillaceae bacterium]